MKKVYPTLHHYTHSNQPFYKRAITLLAMLAFVCANTFAQMKIGTNPTNIKTASLLEMEATDKGVVFPRVGLTSLTGSSPLASDLLEGTMVYNTNIMLGNGPGLYIWKGSKWNSIGMPVYAVGTIPFSNGTALDQNAAQLFWDNANERLGVGTNTPGQKLDVAGNVQIRGTGNGLKFPDGTTQTTAATAGYALPSLSAGSVLFSNGSNLAQNNGQFFWDNTNSRLGIGTSTPATSLDIRSADNSARITVGKTDGSAGGISFGNSSHGVQRGFPTIGGDNNVGLYTTAASIYLSANGTSTSQFVLTNGGNVGIGTSTAPTQKLEVAGNVQVNGTGIFTTAGVGLQLVGTGVGSHTYAEFYPDGLAASRKGWLGYGNNGATSLSLVNSATNGDMWLNTSRNIYLYAGGSNRVAVLGANGFTGIGVTSPGQMLEVGGNIKITGTGSGLIFADGTTQTTAATTGTASNGLSKTGDNFTLGGTLSAATTINQGSNDLFLSGTGKLGIGVTMPTARLEVANTFRVVGGPNELNTLSQMIGDGTVAGSAGFGVGQSFTLPAGAIITEIDIWAGSAGTGTFTVYNGTPAGAVLTSQTVSYTGGWAVTKVILAVPVTVPASGKCAFNASSDGIRRFLMSGENPYSGGEYYNNTNYPEPTYDCQFQVHYTVAGSAVCVNAAGNTGMGNPDATEKLDVVGNIKISGTGNGLKFPDGTTQTTAASTALTTGSVAFGNGSGISQNNSKLFWDNTNNRLGVGTASPAAALHIDGATGGMSSGLGVMISGGTADNPYMELRGSSRTPYIDFAETANVDYTTRLISSGGVLNVQRGSGSGTLLNVEGGLQCVGAVNTSDERLKKQVRPLSGALAGVTSLKAVRYQWNNLGVQHGGDANKEQIGLLAQDVEKVYPEFVTTGNDGYKAVNYAQLTAVLIEAVKEQQQQIETLKTQNELLKTDHDALLRLQEQMLQIQKTLNAVAK